MDAQKIAKKAKTTKFDINNNAVSLFHIMASCGGLVGLITRNMVEMDEIENAASEEEAFSFLKFLPPLDQAKLRDQAKDLVKASFTTNEGHGNQHWHLVLCSYRKMRIKTIIKHIPQETLKKMELKNDCLTTFHTR
jgi:hypothetical protein